MEEKKVAVIGMGLLGTSLAKALMLHAGYRVLAWARREETRQWVRDNNAAHCVYDELDAVLENCDIAVLCMPVDAAIKMFPICAAKLPPHAVVTDIGSVKLDICRAAEEFPSMRFIGSHPMAGTEKSGCEAAFAGLYNNADIFIVPPENADENDVELCRNMWLAAGAARVERITACEHDELVADTSHVLHLLASAMTLSILEAETPENQRRHFAGCATGFRDTTRIASSNPAMWRGIMESNAASVLAALDRFEVQYKRFRATIEDGDFDRFEALFSRGKLLRGAWLGYKKPRPARLVLCGIKHCGKSVTGKALAQLLPAKFVDSDDALFDLYRQRNPESTVSSVREIYRTLGEDGFRRLEGEVLSSLAASPGAMVVALGGGALSNKYVTRDILEKLGEIVWIDVDDAVAWERVRAGGIPPFLAAAADPEAEFIRSNAARRDVFQNYAKLKIVPGAGDFPRDNALRILAALENLS